MYNMNDMYDMYDMYHMYDVYEGYDMYLCIGMFERAATRSGHITAPKRRSLAIVSSIRVVCSGRSVVK